MMQLTDQIAEGNDSNKITMSVGLDQTSAFDCVEYDIMIEKLTLYKMSSRTLNWMSTYLRGRSQYVSIGTKNSSMSTLKQWVPQGSVLGPLLYTLYVNELPQTTKDKTNCQNCISQIGNNKTNYLFDKNCPHCGIVTCFADDSTFVITRKTRNENQQCINEKLDKMTIFLNSNKLTVNLPKTVLLETMTHQKRPRVTGEQPTLDVMKPNGEWKNIKPKKHVKLLGGYPQQNSSWEAHLEGAEKALLPEIRRKIGAIKHLGRNIPRNTKLKLANGFIISMLLYLLPVWGGTPDKYLNKVQILMNKLARHINNQGRMSTTKGLMKSCNWLSIRNLIKSQSLNLMWKIVWQNAPRPISQKMEITDSMELTTTRARLLTTQSTFRWRTTKHWNQLPLNIREINSYPKFKKQVNTWLSNQEEETDLLPNLHDTSQN